MCKCEKDEYCSLCGTSKNEKVNINNNKIERS
jgi:hypothetical protein